ncbi:MAG: sodium/proton-translocating pyrophosphatase, partial [Robiginitomaculum sp.]|nr:sodium/proton-translocating pyrophosphatase [Robiginitomaculum sp.]
MSVAELTKLPLIVGAFGLLVALILYFVVKKYPEGDEAVKKIGDQIHLGAMVFMKREYKMLTMFLLVLTIIVWLALGKETGIAVIVGAVSSSIAGWLGMYAATKANVRTATAAKDHGAAKALTVAFFGGSIMGLCVAALGLIGLGGLFMVYGLGGDLSAESLSHNVHALEGFGIGASCVALFSRIGGGIFTKSADIGADLVGKLEVGIPEDDPRNPGVIADNVGDNVGDVAGMGSDIFESYCGAMIASIAIAATMGSTTLMFLPLALSTIGLIASILMIGVVKMSSGAAPATALRTGTLGAPVIFLAAAYFMMQGMGIETKYWWAVVCGAAGGVAIGLITEYYTGGKPVRKIAKSGETGPATVMI